MIEDLPLVVCIMPTYNRRRFIPNAIRYFLRQDYKNKELLIVDDGTDCIEDLVPDDPQIRYLRTKKNRSLGEKRNLCVRNSNAELIMHWDDDDWMASYRISYQVEKLLANKVEVCGLSNIYFIDPKSKDCWLYKYPAIARNWLAGGSLLYTRNFLEKLSISRYPDSF